MFHVLITPERGKIIHHSHQLKQGIVNFIREYPDIDEYRSSITTGIVSFMDAVNGGAYVGKCLLIFDDEGNNYDLTDWKTIEVEVVKTEEKTVPTRLYQRSSYGMGGY